MSAYEYKNTTVINAKDVEGMLQTVSERTAFRYYKDIKATYGIKIVMFWHFCEYFKIQILS